MPPRIDASPEAVARMLVTSPPKKEWEWQYPEKYGNAPVGDESACRLASGR